MIRGRHGLYVGCIVCGFRNSMMVFSIRKSISKARKIARGIRAFQALNFLTLSGDPAGWDCKVVEINA